MLIIIPSPHIKNISCSGNIFAKFVNIVIDNIDPIEKPVLTEPLANVNSSCEKIDCIYAWTKTTAVNNNISDMLYRI